jgi:N-acetylmuramoyl-L-alanine amidase
MASRQPEAKTVAGADRRRRRKEDDMATNVETGPITVVFRLVSRLLTAFLLFVAGFPCGLADAASEPAAIVRAVAVSAPGGRTVITVDLSKEVPIGVFAIDAPSRLVVDLPAVRFDLARERPRERAGAVTGWRWGEFVAGRSRLVFDLERPMRVARADLTATAGGSGSRLIVELGGSDGSTAAGPIRLGGATAARTAATAETPPAPNGGRPVVVIDPGHGGIDAGTVSPATGVPEKQVVLEVARAVAERLRAEGRCEVVLTRDADVFVGLAERTRIARTHHADLLLSIHADAEYDHSVRGATVYTLSEKASDERAAALAYKENQADAIGGLVADETPDDVAGILGELTLRETRRFSLSFARDLLDEVRANGRSVRGEPHRQAALKVLRAPDVPSVLIEIGFLSNKEDEAQMTSPEWRARTARWLVRAIDRHLVATGRLRTEAGVAGVHHSAANGATVEGAAAASP